MKTGYFLIIFVFPFSAAVECPSSDLPYYEIECPACAIYVCGEKAGVGCPDDFFNECSNFKNATKFIDSKNYLSLDYYDGLVTYVSGCEHELDGQPCIQDKSERFAKEIENYKGGILWNNSNGQNGAMKVITIVVFGWIFYACTINLWVSENIIY